MCIYCGEKCGEALGVDLIAAERDRQISKGFTREHDKQHTSQNLLRAANAYLNNDWMSLPWGAPISWKDQSERERLIKAGALIAAALDAMVPE